MATAAAAAATAMPTQGLAADSEPPDTEGRAQFYFYYHLVFKSIFITN